MDRPIYQTGALPRTTDVLNASKFAMYGLGFMIEAAIGSNTGIAGLAFGLVGGATPLAFTIGRGSIYTVEAADASAYSTLGTDTNSIGKQGINPAAQTFNLATAVGSLSSGYSQYVLVEFAYSDVDTGSTVLPFYNSSNPSAPYSGPANAGTSSYTVRRGFLNVTLKYGTAAPTGSQTIPSVDSGFVPGYVILIYNGMSTLTSTNYWTHPSAPFFPNLESLAAQHGNASYGTAGTFSWTCPANVYSVQAFVTGGGGAGQGISSVQQLGGTGGAGGTAIKRCAVTPGYSYTVVCGAGGTGVASGVGNSGGSSSFGGATGNGGVAAAAGGFINGGGGSASGGDFNITGGDGMDGTGNYADGYGPTTTGGASFWGGGASSGTIGGGVCPTPGGGGASVYTNTGTGGTGGVGCVFLTW